LDAPHRDEGGQEFSRPAGHTYDRKQRQYLQDFVDQQSGQCSSAQIISKAPENIRHNCTGSARLALNCLRAWSIKTVCMTCEATAKSGFDPAS